MPLLTIQDMHRLIEQDIQNMGFFAYDDLESEEIDLKINEQIYKFIEAVVDKSQGRRPRIGVNEGFQENQVNLDSLRTIHIRELSRTLTPITGVGAKFVLPDDYLHHIKSKVTVTYSCVENKETVTKTITPSPSIRIGESQNIDFMKRSAFHKTKKESPLAEIVNNEIFIYSNGFNITEAYLDYIKRPAKVLYAKDGNGDYDSGNSVDCDLPDTVHYMIVDMTVKKILKVTEAQQQKIVNLEQS